MSRSLFFLFLTSMLGLYIGRKTGWWLSKMYLYTGPLVPVVLLLVVWGGIVALFLRLAIDWLQPGIIPKVIGYGAAAYVSNPAFGLILEDTVPLEERDRHLLCNNLPLVAYAVTAIVLAWKFSPLVN